MFEDFYNHVDHVDRTAANFFIMRLTCNASAALKSQSNYFTFLKEGFSPKKKEIKCDSIAPALKD